MRVLAVGNMYPPHSFGGYELVWQSAMRHLVQSGHRVRVLTTDFDSGTSERDDDGVYRELRWYLRDHEFPRLPRRERLALERHNQRVLQRHLRELEPEVVAWWAMGGMSLSMIERVRTAGIPAVGFVIDDWLEYGPKADGWISAFAVRAPRVRTLATRITGVPTSVDLEHAAHYVFTSETTRRRSGVTVASSIVAPCGIDPSFIDPVPEAPWTWSLLYVGRLDPRKGVDTAIAALADLPDAATLDIVGGWDAAEEARLRELARERGVEERVRFVGHRSPAEVREVYARANAVLFPVIWEEPWGLVPIEAMARGRPVVATGRGGSGEYMRDGDNVLLFEAEDPRGLAAAVRRLAGDPALRSRLIANGLDTARRHTSDVYNEVVLRELAAAAGEPVDRPVIGIPGGG